MGTKEKPLAGADKIPAIYNASADDSIAAYARLATLPILTKQQCCALLQCQPKYLERAIRTGRLRMCKLSGKMVRILRRDLEAWLESCASMDSGGVQ